MWTNLILIRERMGGPDDPFEDVPPQLHRNEDVMCVAVSILRERDDQAWHDLAEKARKAHPTSRRTRRAAAEAMLDRTVTVGLADAPKLQDLSRAVAPPREASEVLAELWRAFATTEVDASAVDLTLLLNTLTGFRLADDRPRVLALVDAIADALLADAHGRSVVAVIGLEAGRADLVEQALAEPFEGRGLVSLELALRRQAWRDALHIVETDEDELHTSIDPPPAQGADVLRAASAPEDERAVALQTILDAEPLDAHSVLFLSRVARACGVWAVSDAALRRAARWRPCGARCDCKSPQRRRRATGVMR